LTSPVNILNVVVLPAPFTPNSAKHSPLAIVNEISSTATVNLGKVLEHLFFILYDKL